MHTPATKSTRTTVTPISTSCNQVLPVVSATTGTCTGAGTGGTGCSAAPAASILANCWYMVSGGCVRVCGITWGTGMGVVDAIWYAVGTLSVLLCPTHHNVFTSFALKRTGTARR